MVYNMGQAAEPIVNLQQKVNDGKYHRIKFVRSGAEAMLEVDWENITKSPLGKWSKVFFLTVPVCCLVKSVVS